MFFRFSFIVLSLSLFFPIIVYAQMYDINMKVRLSPPQFKTINLKELLNNRYSCRKFIRNKSLNIEDLSTILWAAVGKKEDALTSPTRTIPSAGATYPLEIFVLVGEKGIKNIDYGLYQYLWQEHSLKPLYLNKDLRLELSEACLKQNFIKEAPASLIITAIFHRTTYRYGERGERYVYLEAGHAAQNISLAVVNLGLATVEVGAFHDERINKILGLEDEYSPLIVMPIGFCSE